MANCTHITIAVQDNDAVKVYEATQTSFGGYLLGKLSSETKHSFAGNAACAINVCDGTDLHEHRPHSLVGRMVLWKRKGKSLFADMTGTYSEISQSLVAEVSPSGKYIRLVSGDWWPMDALEILDVLEDKEPK